VELESMLAEQMTDWTREWKQIGLEEGWKEGWMEGCKEGERKLFLILLTNRFGALPAWVLERVQSASMGQVEAWAQLIFNASSTDELYR
jgi:flagellar biosynthesis/type III secretory pathway protein FliH